MPMSDKKRWIRLAVAAGLGAAAGAWTYQIQKDKKAKNDARLPFSWKQYYGVWGK